MTDQTAQEPTMEEILASIRRIISEDDAPAETAEAGTEADADAEPVVAATPVDDPVAEAEDADEDVLELSEPIEVEAVESIGDLDVTGPEAVAEPEPEPFPAEPLDEAPAAPEPVAPPVESAAPVSDTPAYDTLVGDSASASAASAFAGFASTLRKSEPMDSPATVGPTIDELVRSLLRPLLKDWLDANLPGIVEAEVRKEVERIARNAG